MSVMTDDPRAEQLVCCSGYCLAGQSPVHEPDCPNHPDAGICPWCERPLHRLGERCPVRQTPTLEPKCMMWLTLTCPDCEATREVRIEHVTGPGLDTWELADRRDIEPCEHLTDEREEELIQRAIDSYDPHDVDA